MSAPQFTADNFLSALQALAPRGRVWPREPDAVQTKVMRGLVAIYERQSARNLQLLMDAFPGTTYELLGEWEQSLGLPDPCAGASPTLAGRIAQVVARFAGTGAVTVPQIIAFAAALGYTITITQFKPYDVSAPVNVLIYGPEWVFAWQVNAPLNTVTTFTVIGGVNEPLADWGNAVLECVLSAIAPAHTAVIFSYT